MDDPKDLKTEKLGYGTKYTGTVGTDTKLYFEMIIVKQGSSYVSLFTLSDNKSVLATNTAIMEQTAGTIK